MLIEAGDLFTAKLYYRGTSGPYKIRPVLVVDDSSFPMVTLAEITTTEPNIPPKYFDRFKIEVKDWKTAGLHEQSWVKCYLGNVHRVHRNRLNKRIGSVNEETLIDVLITILNQSKV